MPVFIFVSADDIVKQLLEDEEDFDPEEVVAASTVRSTLGPEAQQIYDIASDDFKAAVERGSTARYDIDFHEHNAWPFYDDDSGWQQSFYSSYYVTSGGKIKIVLEEGDADGNWDWADSAVLDTPEYTALVKEFSHGSWQRRMRDYMVWVAEHGDDPLDEFTAPRDHLPVNEPDRPLTQEEIEAHYRHAAQEQLDRWTEPTDADEVPYWS